jgi:carboxyl-terminal processing protease
MKRLQALFVAGAIVAVSPGASAQSNAVLKVAKGGGEQYDSIQAAIAAAPAHATIQIAAGIYEENLVVDKPLVLSGAGWERTVVVAKTTNGPSATALSVSKVQGVVVRGLKFADPTPGSKRVMADGAVLLFLHAGADVRECAVVGGPGYGIVIAAGSEVSVRDCLVAALWGRGVAIYGGKGTTTRARVNDCEVRNCCGGGLIVGSGTEGVRIEHCRVSGCGMHGIRYDDAAPTVVSNLVFGNAISGIYASGNSAAAVRGNLFYHNEMNGMSCWPGNGDTIEENTFVENLREGIAVLGSASPALRQNIFCAHAQAIVVGRSGGGAPGATAPSGLTLEGNLFWHNGSNWVLQPRTEAPTKFSTMQTGENPLPESTRSAVADPGFGNASGQDFNLAAGSAARREGIGANGLLAMASPWPLQPEEAGMIPEGKSREARWWRKSVVRSAQTQPLVSYEQTFTELFQTLGAAYPFFRLKNIDWPAVGRELLPRSAKVKTDSEFGLLCLELVARLEDSHASLGEGRLDVPSVPFPNWHGGFACLLGEAHQPIIYCVVPDSPAEKAGLRPGMVLTQINGQPAEKAMEQLMKQARQFSGFSSDRFLRCQAVQWLGLQSQQNATVSLELQTTNGQSLHTNLPASLQWGPMPRLPVPIPGVSESANVSWTRLDNDTGYIQVRRIRDDLIPKLDQAVAELKNAQGLILDVRGNSGGGFDSRRAERNFSLNDREEPERPRFKGPMALLLDSWCISAGEGWASWFIAEKRARTFGETTAGTSSAKRTYTLTNGYYSVTFPIRPYKGFLDRAIERRGLEPDVPLRQKASDLAAGRDTVLEAAKSYLLSLQGKKPG